LQLSAKPSTMDMAMLYSHQGQPTMDENNTIISSYFPNRAEEIPVTIAQCIPFPFKLYDLLEESDREGYGSIISWMPNSSAFTIYDKKAFSETLMAKYFKQTQFKSFQRQLNNWGFERISCGPEKGAYSHPSFVRGKPALCRYIRRRTCPKTLRKRAMKDAAATAAAATDSFMQSQSVGEHRRAVSEGGAAVPFSHVQTQVQRSLGDHHRVVSVGAKVPFLRTVSDTSTQVLEYQRALNQALTSSRLNESWAQLIDDGLPSSSLEPSPILSSPRLDPIPLEKDEVDPIPFGSPPLGQTDITTDIGMDWSSPSPTKHTTMDPVVHDGDSVAFEGKNFFFVEDYNTSTEEETSTAVESHQQECSFQRCHSSLGSCSNQKRSARFEELSLMF